jgi:hypothetical protein
MHNRPDSSELFAEIRLGREVTTSLLNEQNRLLRLSMRESMRRDPRNTKPLSLVPHGYRVYSQDEEDGMIREIFRRIGTTNKRFIEFGIGDGVENNTHALLFEDWNGLWIESDMKWITSIRQQCRKVIARQQLVVLHSRVTCANINPLIASVLPGGEIDLLSIDIDGNDWHVCNAITAVQPRVIVIEYNAKFPPPISYCIEYTAEFSWDGTDAFGASLQFLETNMAKKGYTLVGCSLCGINAFFVRSDLAADKFLKPFSAAEHYQPPRYELLGDHSGHLPSFLALERALTANSSSASSPATLPSGTQPHTEPQ